MPRVIICVSSCLKYWYPKDFFWDLYKNVAVLKPEAEYE